MAKRKGKANRRPGRSGTHLTRNKAASGSAPLTPGLEGKRGSQDVEIEASALRRIEETQEVLRAHREERERLSEAFGEPLDELADAQERMTRNQAVNRIVGVEDEELDHLVEQSGEILDTATKLGVKLKPVFDHYDALLKQGIATHAVRQQILEQVEYVMLDMEGVERLGPSRWRFSDDGRIWTTSGLAKAMFPNAFIDPTRAYSRWEDVMVAQQRLHEFTESHSGQAFLGAFQASMNAQHPPRARMPDGFIHAAQAQMLSEAEPVYVSGEMTELVDEARQQWEPEVVHPSDAFVQNGFALLARAIDIHDAPYMEDGSPGAAFRSRDGILPIRAVGWLSVHNEDRSAGAFWISYYNHIDDEPGHWERTEVERRQMLSLHGPLVLGHTFQQTWYAKPVEGALSVRVEGEAEEDTIRRAKEQTALFQTLWRLAGQFVPVRRKAPRGIRRDFHRKTGSVVQDVQVVVLRRARGYEEEGEPTGRTLNWTIIVQGYWSHRWQKEDPMQPPNGPLVKRQVWVKTHTKGQGPLKETERVWEWRR